jgi:TldD protein
MIEPQQKILPGTDALSIVTQRLLGRSGLTPVVLDRALGAALERQVDYADLYFQQTRYETWTVEDGIVKEGVYSIDQGVGVRCVSGERTGFAYADQLDEAALLDAVEAARGIAQVQGRGTVKVARPTAYQPLYGDVDPLTSLDDRAKVELLADLDVKVRAMDSRIIQVVASLAGVHELVLVQASAGTLPADVRPLVRRNG